MIHMFSCSSFTTATDKPVPSVSVYDNHVFFLLLLKQLSFQVQWDEGGLMSIWVHTNLCNLNCRWLHLAQVEAHQFRCNFVSVKYYVWVYVSTGGWMSKWQHCVCMCIYSVCVCVCTRIFYLIRMQASGCNLWLYASVSESEMNVDGYNCLIRCLSVHMNA